MTAPTSRTLPSPLLPAPTEQMPALPTKHEMFLEVVTAPMEGSAHLNAALAVSRAGSLLEVELVDSQEGGCSQGMPCPDPPDGVATGGIVAMDSEYFDGSWHISPS